ncbi:MAG: hypothetical protein WCL57_11965 [Chloroflexota bacterium]|jgi:hypothetical protein|nr:hypothetical protein [Chloroflexota bacterium]
MKFFRPTEQTKFHIDYNWFDEKGQDVNVLIQKYLTAEQLERLGNSPNTTSYDYIDEDTGEVQHVNAAVKMIRDESAKAPDFISARTPVFEAAFRIFLVNNNKPLTTIELAAMMGRRSSDVLTQLSGRVVYNGIKPITMV